MPEYDVSAKSYLAENLRIVISIWKMDQRAFAALIGLNYGTFNSYMNESAFPRVPTLLVISDVTGIPIDLFLRQSIPVHLIPERPLVAGEQNPNLVQEKSIPYRTTEQPIGDFDAVERRLLEIERRLKALEDCR